MGAEDLERRIAAALNSTDATAADLGRLCAETDAAVIAADEAAAKAKLDALDPSISPDPRKARQAAEDAQFIAGRLRTLLSRMMNRSDELAASRGAG